ncbi:MAG: DUF6504 family protein [bacterium]|jgi:hypothetical protein
MRLVEHPVTVTATDGGPHFFQWRKKRYFVTAVLERWVDTGAWWENEPEKVFYRLLADDGGLYELYQERISGCWFLYKVYD